MSAHNPLSRYGISLFFFLSVVVVGSLFAVLPQTAFADEVLPVGVLERQTCGSTSLDVYGYGAGLMQNNQPTVVTDAHISEVSVSQNCAVVRWNTEHPVATLVLFAEISAEPIGIKLGAENFGYPYATMQNNAGVAAHVAVLEGLQPGVAYSYRIVTRSHPNALPQISDARTFVVGSTAPVVTVPPTTPVTQTPPITTTPETAVAEQPVQEVPAAPVAEIPTEEPTGTGVPSALTAAQQALDGTRESALLSAIGAFFARLVPNPERLSLTSTIGLFEADTYIVPTLFFLALIFLLQHIVLPAFSVSLKNPLLYWLLGSMVLAIVAAVFMLYYVSLVAVAVFLGALARYLLQNTPGDTDSSAATQPKLLETAETKKKAGETASR